MRYSYGLTSALLLGGAALTLTTGYPAGAQVAQNDDSQMARVVPRAGAPESFADLTAQLQPAVVNISTRQRIQVAAQNPFAGTPFEGLFGGSRGNQPQTREAQSLGSGFLISADGYVVTNNHVISPQGRGEVQEITVTLSDGTELPAKLVGKDASSDLAVLKVDRRQPFPFVKFGDSSQARVGDWVIAIGNPFALGGTVTSGIVSAVHRNTGSGAYDRYIQTDASINRGNSGGPLFDMQGNVIGINRFIVSESGGSVGLGFAIPAEVAEPIVAKLRAGQEVTRGYLGLTIQPVVSDLADSLNLPPNRGEFVQSVEPGQAADRAGIRAGDVVTKVNGREVTNEQTLSFIVANIAPGTRIPIELYREGRRRTVTAVVGKRPSEEELAQSQLFNGNNQPDDTRPVPGAGGEALAQNLGLQVTPLTPRFAQQLGVAADSGGLVILGVDPNADAGQKGLQPGDIVVTANYRPVNTVADLQAIVGEAKAAGRESVLLRIQRRGRPLTYLPVRLR